MSHIEPLDEYDDWLSSNDWLDNTYMSKYSQVYDSNDMDSKLSAAASAESKTFTGKDFNTLVEDERNTGQKHYVQSVVGDDESDTSNSKLFSLLIIFAGPVISKIKLSYKDCGISHYIANFAEGWILSPLNSEASFEATNRRHARSGVPWVLDVPKLKYISPVRKQSNMELDLESKYVHLAKAADWTHREWFTYHFHQMALLLANCVFDFVDGRTFPYLYKEEGGCGGMPPYQNLATSFSHLMRFNRGKSTRAILGVMDECVRIHHRQMSPSEGIFVKASHLAQMGDKRWLAFTQAYTDLIKTGQISRAELRDMMRGDITSNLPQDILDMSVEVESTDPVIGSAISHLRKEGLLLTELDVKMILENRKRQEAIGGDRPLKTVIEEIEDEKRHYKANHWKVLSLLSTRPEFNDLCTIIPPNPYEEASMAESSLWNILGEYYSLRSSTHDLFTSFQYSDVIRIFKRSDIEHLVRKTPSLLREDIAQGIDLPGIIRSFKMEIPSERKRKEEVLEWLEADDLKSLLLRPLPPGVGPDDGRIFRSIMSALDEEAVKNQPTLMVIIISSDRQLCARVFAYVKHAMKNKVLLFANISAKAYVRLCLGMIREENERADVAARKRRMDMPSKFTLFNYITGREMPIPIAMNRQISSKILGRNSKVLIEFDYPNVERYLERTRYEASTNSLVEITGGYLNEATLTSLPAHYCWSALPIAKIENWSDFDKSSIKRYPLANLFDDSVSLYRPLMDAHASIDSWRVAVASLSGEG